MDEQQTYQRAINASLAGLAVQLITALGLLILALWSGNGAAMAASWHAFGGLALWGCLWVVFQQHRLERLESLEAEQLARRHGADSSIFETRADDLSVARRRLDWLYKWVVPLVSLATSGYLIGVGVWLLNGALGAVSGEAAALSDRADPLALGFVAGAIAFVGFVVSRYVAGMAKLPRWAMLRGGAAYLMGVAVIAAILTIAFFLVAGFDARLPLIYLAVAVPIVMILIGAEMALNFVLDFYRPRRAEQRPRPAFDSRLLSLLTAPESFAHTISEAINYQFGFEITRSWFWQLLSRVFGRLLVLAALILLAASCVVIVEANQRALITRFGALASEPIGPGLHLKLPWPVSRTRTYDVSRVREMSIGTAKTFRADRPILWSNEHAEGEAHGEPMIVAPPSFVQAGDDPTAQSNAPSVSLVAANITLLYRPDPEKLIEYVRSSVGVGDAGEFARLRALAQQEIGRHLLRHTVDDWIGRGRDEAGEQMRRRIQAAAERAGLGVEVAGVVIAGIHPPQQVAEAFHNVNQAEQARQTAIERARQDAIGDLVEVAGSTDIADRIVAEIETVDEMERGRPSEDQVSDKRRRIEDLLLQAGGEAAKRISEARGFRWTVENTERGEAERFAERVEAYRNAPELYRARLLLKAVTEGLPDARKFIIASQYGDLTIRGDFKKDSSGFNQTLDQIEREGIGP